mgnify:CR=1 FL=1
MKALHVWSGGRIAPLLARHFPGSKVYIRIQSEDPFCIGEDPIVRYAGPDLAGEIIKDAVNYDIIHLHAIDWILPALREKYPDKPIVMHHHGQNLRENVLVCNERLKLADLVIYSTPDLATLLPDDAVWLPNIIDEQLFKPAHWAGRGTMFPFEYERHSPFVKQVLEKFPQAVIYNRMYRYVPYWRMPSLLSSFAELISWKPEVDYKSTAKMVLTLTDLEMLALGKAVYYWDRDFYITEFPEIHKTENVIPKLEELYARVLK